MTPSFHLYQCCSSEFLQATAFEASWGIIPYRLRKSNAWLPWVHSTEALFVEKKKLYLNVILSATAKHFDDANDHVVSILYLSARLQDTSLKVNQETWVFECNVARVWALLSNASIINYAQREVFIHSRKGEHFLKRVSTLWTNSEEFRHCGLVDIFCKVANHRTLGAVGLGLACI